MQLESFAEDEENQKSLPRTVEKAGYLRRYLLEIHNTRSLNGTERSLNENEVEYFHNMVLQFETSLDDELQRLHTYAVDPVAAYSFDRLIGAADTVFPEEQRRKGLIPEQALIDFRSAGRCLAFDLPTACGFHAFRATDEMLRAYCNHFGAHLKGHGRDWGRYITALRDVLENVSVIKKPNKRTGELLDSIRATDRNPLVHPELNLDADGALQMFNLCQNAVSLMVRDITNSP
jgi:hypothetical protein